MNSCRGYSLVEVLLALMLLSVTSLLLFAYLQQSVLSEREQSQRQAGWQAAAQALEGNTQLRQPFSIQEWGAADDCRWRQANVRLPSGRELVLTRLICQQINSPIPSFSAG